MAMTVGELVATFDIDASGAAAGITRAEAAVAGLQRDVDGTFRDMAGNAVRSGAEIGQALGNGIRLNLDEALADLHPQIAIDADSRPAEAEVVALIERMRRLSATIDVDAPVDGISAEIEAIRAQLQALASSHPDVQIQANAANALMTLDFTRHAVDSLNGRTARINVQAPGAAATIATLTAVRATADRTGDSDGPGRLASMLSSVGSSLGGVLAQAGQMGGIFGAAAGPISGLIATLVNIVPAAAIATTALLSVAQAGAAIKIGTSGVGSALKAAFSGTPSSGGGGGGGQSAADAARQQADAERTLADAQRSELTAQQNLSAARKQAVRDLQDMNNQLKDGQLDQRRATLDLQEAQEKLAQVKASGADADSEQMQEAQLAYDQAKQHLAETTTAQQRLTTDTAAANRAGVDGTQRVKQAQDQLRSSQEAVTRAQEALNQKMSAGASGGGGVNALAAALAKLSPSARAFVQAVIALKPAWDALKLDVQQRLFQGLAGALKSTAGSVLPTLRKELTNSAGALNDMAKGVLGAAKGLGDSGILGSAMHSASTGLHNLSGIPGLVVTAFGQLASAAGPQFDKLTKSVGNGASEIGKALTAAFKDGSLTRAIDDAVHLIGEIITIGKNVGSVLMSVFNATSQSGGSFLDVLKTISGMLAKTFASPAVQSALKALFGVFDALAKTAAPLLEQAFGVIAPVLTALGPPVQGLISALGKALSPIIKALGPVLKAAADAVGKFLGAIEPLLPVISLIISSAGPILTPILSALGDIFQQMEPLITALAQSMMGLLKPILQSLPTIIGPLMKVFVQLATQLLPQITDMVTKQAPVLKQLGESFAEVMKALAPVIPALGTLISDGLEAMLPLLPPVTKLFAQLAGLLAGELAHQITLIVVPALNLLTDILSGNFSKAGRDAKTLVSGIIKVIAGLPAVATAALGDIGLALIGAGRALMDGLMNGIVSKIDALKSLFHKITALIPKIKGPASVDAKLLTPNGQLVMQSFITGIASQLPALHSQMSGITSDIGGSVGGRFGVAGGSMNRGAPSSSGSSQPIQLTVVLGGTQLGRALVDPLRRAVKEVGGGSVQVAFGTGRA
ncbi:hypothetical protein ACEZDB_26900 [Streptacidiphilus sp. N1-3]|uniref:Phage-related protein n=1 Tax=Streptacidiphilus alkalitolerans TaxID=3342712 RepID=A0ABV6X7K9_9ACTN